MTKSRVPPKLSLIDRLELAISTGHTIDGVWIGASVDDSKLGTTSRRLEAALSLIKMHDPPRYRRMLQDLSRIWVRLLPRSAASFNSAAGACQLDTRFVLDEGVSTAEIACAIIHEATHARIANRGIPYDEPRRRRIELACRRQELRLARRLPGTSELQVQLCSWLTAPPEATFWTNSALAQGRIDGVTAGLLYLGVPRWAIVVLLTFRRPFRWLRGTA